jgi:hypothetical protein
MLAIRSNQVRDALVLGEINIETMLQASWMLYGNLIDMGGLFKCWACPQLEHCESVIKKLLDCIDEAKGCWK